MNEIGFYGVFSQTGLITQVIFFELLKYSFKNSTTAKYIFRVELVIYWAILIVTMI